jgi:hypothetical protein
MRNPEKYAGGNPISGATKQNPRAKLRFAEKRFSSRKYGKLG